MAGQCRIIEKAGKYLCLEMICFVMNPQVICTVLVADIYQLWLVPVQTYSFVACGAKNKRLALLQHQCFCSSRTFFSKNLKCAIIEDVAVLVYLEK